MVSRIFFSSVRNEDLADKYGFIPITHTNTQKSVVVSAVQFNAFVFYL